MPEMRSYTVTRTQTVKVTANDPASAVAIGNQAFETDESVNWSDPWGHTDAAVRTTDLSAVETGYLKLRSARS